MGFLLCFDKRLLDEWLRILRFLGDNALLAEDVVPVNGQGLTFWRSLPIAQ